LEPNKNGKEGNTENSVPREEEEVVLAQRKEALLFKAMSMVKKTLEMQIILLQRRTMVPSDNEFDDLRNLLNHQKRRIKEVLKDSSGDQMSIAASGTLDKLMHMIASPPSKRSKKE